MQGIRGSISPSTISPIEVLGIHARDEAERRRYAEEWARIMYEDAGRILAFQQAYDEAVKRLYPHQPLIDVSRLPGKSAEKPEHQATDRLGGPAPYSWDPLIPVNSSPSLHLPLVHYEANEMLSETSLPVTPT